MRTLTFLVIISLLGGLMTACDEKDRSTAPTSPWPTRPPIRSISLDMAEDEMLSIMPPYQNCVSGCEYQWYFLDPFDYCYWIEIRDGVVFDIEIEERVERNGKPSINAVTLSMTEDAMLTIMKASNRLYIYKVAGLERHHYIWQNSPTEESYDITIWCEGGVVASIWDN